MINVIIVTYNGLKWIDKCLGSIQNQPLVSEIIVIDNGSTDGTTEYIQRTFPQVNLIINKENHGFGHSNNQGLTISLEDRCQQVFLLNQDAWIERDTLNNLINVQDKHPAYGILSPMHLRGDGNALDMKFATFIAQSENHQLISDLYLHRNDLKAVYDVKFVNAAAWLITRKCFEKIGGFAPIYHHYGEDMDYANRALFHGFKIGVCTSSIIHHDRKNEIELPNVTNPNRYLKIKKIWHLIYLTDIRHSFTARYLKLSAVTINNCLRALTRLQLKSLWTYSRELVIILALAPKVLKNNALTKREGAIFLKNE